MFGLGKTIRQAYDLVADAFGPGANAPFLVAMDVDRVGGQTGIDRIAQTLHGTDGVASVSPAQLSPSGTAAVLNVTPTTGPQDDATLMLVEWSREAPDRMRVRLPGEP